MAAIAAAFIVAGTAVSLYGQRKQAKAEKEAYAQKAMALGMQSDELIARAKINIQQMEREGAKQVGSFDARIAGSGVDASTNRLEMLSNISENIRFERRVAEFDAKMLRMGMQSALTAGHDASQASKIQMFSTLMGGAGKAYAAGKS